MRLSLRTAFWSRAGMDSLRGSSVQVCSRLSVFGLTSLFTLIQSSTLLLSLWSLLATQPASLFPTSPFPSTRRCEYIGEHQLYYDCDAVPGSPILANTKVVGLHESRGRGVSLKGMCKVLAGKSGFDSFVQRCVGEKDVLGQSPFWSKLFSVVHRRLLSFDIVSRKYQTYTKLLPVGALIAYFPSSIVLTGGCEGEQPVATTLSFNSEEQGFEVLREMATRRARHSACVHEGFLYVVSGISHDGVTNECERFNPKKNQWLPIYPLSHGRVDSSLVSFQSSLYCYGGSNKYGRSVPELEQFHNSTWTDVPFAWNAGDGKVALLASDKDVIVLGRSAGVWDLKKVRSLGKMKDGVPGDIAVMREGAVFVFVGVKVLEGRVLSNSIAWKSYDSASLNAYFSRL